MRLAPLFLTASAAALLAVNALAQDAAPPPENGLSGLGNTIEGLEDSPSPEAAAPAPAPATEPEPSTGVRLPPVPPQPRPVLTGPPQPLSRADLAALDAAVQRGRLLGLIDRSGRFATQDMLSRISDPSAAGISGWIAEPEGNGVAVTFYADGDAGPVTVYRVNILGGRVVSRDVHVAVASRPPLNPLQARMAAARAATGRLDNRPCAGEDFNVFVVPPMTADGPIDVYQISPQTRRGFYFLGGHFKTSIAPDGSVAARRSFTNACLDTAVADPVAGARPAPIAVTHLLDPLPQDVHVFLSIWTGHPLVVVAGDPQRLFAVTPDRIAEVPR
ncbi:MAG TPA: hypothetical protein VMS43_15670 [Allosphingosinicella sp.]|nr:hypothetical protein [Allosphingosinicella sp.]